jgi:exosome complex RNA-binding protein Rrp4
MCFGQLLTNANIYLKMLGSESSVVPGSKVGTVTEFIPGEGVYVKNNVIYASLVGFLSLTRPEGSVRRSASLVCQVR